jgi:hypothetical protein
LPEGALASEVSMTEISINISIAPQPDSRSRSRSFSTKVSSVVATVAKRCFLKSLNVRSAASALSGG